MCLIAVKNKGVELPKRDSLYNGYQNNPDGVGIAILKENKNLIYIKKDFPKFNDFYKWASENIKRNDIAIIHFRQATSGNTDMGNRHPFPIARNRLLLRKTNLLCRFAVAHNGVISDYSYKTGKYSDTQKFVVDILSNLKYKLDNLGVQKLLSRYIAGDKLAIINSLKRKVILIGNYVEDKGIFYSNDGYKFEYKVFDSYKNYCDICSSGRKVKYDTKTKMFLCKKCRRKLRKYGEEKLMELMYAQEGIDDRDVPRYESNTSIKKYNTVEREQKDLMTVGEKTAEMIIEEEKIKRYTNDLLYRNIEKIKNE